MWIEPEVADGAAMPGYIRFQARFGHRRAEAETLWFDVPEPLGAEAGSSDTFWLQSVLPLAFQRQQILESEIAVDPVWLQNANQAMQVWSRWQPGLKPIEIRAPVSSPAALPATRRIGLFFTGGVDSFYSLFRHDQTAATHSPGAKADDLIYVGGYDIPRANIAALKSKTDALQSVADRLGKQLIVITTNLRETRLRELDWGLFMHGPALGAAGLLLESRWSQVLLSAGGCIDDDTPWGSHPLTDPLMSTASTQVIRYSNNVTRFAKVEFLARFPVALEQLHVCWVRESHDNCGECEKCIRTMLMLEVVGALGKTSCFPSGDIMAKLRTVRVTSPQTVPLWEDLLKPAAERGRPDIVQEIERCLARSAEAIRKSKHPPVLKRWERGFRSFRKRVLG